MNKDEIIRLVEQYAKAEPPETITIEPFHDKVRFDGKFWSVPVRTNYHGRKQYPLQEKLAQISLRLRDEKGIWVLLLANDFQPMPKTGEDFDVPPHTDFSNPKLRKVDVLALVHQYMEAEEPTDVLVEIFDKFARREGKGWRIPVRTDHAMPNRARYYEKLADVEMRLYDENHLNVMLVPS